MRGIKKILCFACVSVVFFFCSCAQDNGDSPVKTRSAYVVSTDTTHAYVYEFLHELIVSRNLDTSYGLEIKADPTCYNGDDEAEFLSRMIVPDTSSVAGDRWESGRLPAGSSVRPFLQKKDVESMLVQRARFKEYKWDNGRLHFDLNNKQNWLVLSVPLFTPDGNTVFIKISSLCPGKCGVGSSRIFRRQNGKWDYEQLDVWVQ